MTIFTRILKQVLLSAPQRPGVGPWGCTFSLSDRGGLGKSSARPQLEPGLCPSYNSGLIHIWKLWKRPARNSFTVKTQETLKIILPKLGSRSTSQWKDERWLWVLPFMNCALSQVVFLSCPILAHSGISPFLGFHTHSYINTTWLHPFFE